MILTISIFLLINITKLIAAAKKWQIVSQTQSILTKRKGLRRKVDQHQLNQRKKKSKKGPNYPNVLFN